MIIADIIVNLYLQIDTLCSYAFLAGDLRALVYTRVSRKKETCPTSRQPQPEEIPPS